ncbi:hypothetical protein [Nonomuraea gerenzanensis]|uniref:Uncharacterized protein n=1 Tax=Nonomuraea gerenzanensis TaxID=93944 RepID=A0A1M4E778_9ACTN|nr:hypothetical protein [Nonomuraea gerenzanensis]UBU16944.1 hypothetical protein LCN96_18560 [Nonomuraea gerenzanensis]SBO94666.1 hypothetical protein BN4615_P4182 [Nonomuraea gerenzanensis]
MHHTSIGTETHHLSTVVCSARQHAAASHQAGEAESDAVAGIPLVRPGIEPGYTIPAHVAAAGVPRGAQWKTVAAAGPCEEQWAEVKKVCPGCFNDRERERGTTVIDHRTPHPTARLVLDHFEELIARYAGHLAFGGCLGTRYPWRAATAVAEGGTLMRYSVGSEIRKVVTVSGGWAAGGTIDITVPGHAQFTGSYTHGVGDSGSWPSSDTVHAHLLVTAGERCRIDVHGIGGVYSGSLYFAMAGFPAHDERGARCFDLGGHHIWTTSGYLCFPLRDAFVKSPDAPSAVLRLRRTWPGSAPEPGPAFP